VGNLLFINRAYTNIVRKVFAGAVLFCLAFSLNATPVEAAPSISPISLPNGQVNGYYSAQLIATCNGTCGWSFTGGALPPGLTLSPTGLIQGTPTAMGSYTFIATVTDSTGSASGSFTITITAPPITFNTSSLPTATIGQPYSASISATGGTGTITYALTSGNLPSGLMFNAGIISGTPAQGTAGYYNFTVTATAGSSTAQQSFSLLVEKGYYDAFVSISPGLAEGQTRVYVDNVLKGTLRGGDSIKLTRLDPDVITNVSVDPTVTSPGRTDIRYKAETSSASIRAGISQVTFNYNPEYYIDVKTDPSGIATVSGTGWYREGVPISLTAPDQIDKDADSQYRFSYWLTPSNDKIKSTTLNVTGNQPGRYLATYDLYYRFTIVSEYGNIKGGGWQKAGSTGSWSLISNEVAMPGILGFFGGKYRAQLPSGSEIIDGPKTITVKWDPDYTVPAITIPLTIIIIGGIIYGIYALVRRKEPVAQPMPYQPPAYVPPPPPPVYPQYQAPPPPQIPAMPPPQTTVVMIGNGAKKPPTSTREQLMEKFGELLQKYEEELSQGRELPIPSEVPEIETTVSKKSLPAPEASESSGTVTEVPSTPAEECGQTTKKLLRTVVTHWRNTNIKPITVIPGDKKSAALAGGRTVTWTREKYNEWELHICKLPVGHKGIHKGTTEIVYSLIDTINEELNYGPKQPLKPPTPHYTDGMPEIDIPASQIIPPDQLPA
jgi:hypothetical protein